MSNQFLAEVRAFGFNFAPTGWAFCDGRLLPIAQYSALFSLISTTYGGDGKVNFALPNMQQRAPIGAGQGPNLSDYALGEATGETTATLTESEMASHSHTFHARSPTSGSQVAISPGPGVQVGRAIYNNAEIDGFSASQTVPGKLASNSVVAAGSSLPHSNVQPCLTINFCIALLGTYPTRG